MELTQVEAVVWWTVTHLLLPGINVLSEAFFCAPLSERGEVRWRERCIEAHGSIQWALLGSPSLPLPRPGEGMTTRRGTATGTSG